MQTDTLSATFRAAQLLNFMLIVIIIFLSLACFLMLFGSLIFQFDNPVKASLLEKLHETGAMVPSAQALTLGYLSGAMIAGAYLYVACVVKAIIHTTLKGNPFVEANISRLRKTWIIIALVEIFRTFVTGLIPSVSSSNSALDGFSLETRISAWFLVFVIAAMAEVFRIGLELKRDQELTV